MENKDLPKTAVGLAQMSYKVHLPDVFYPFLSCAICGLPGSAEGTNVDLFKELN